MRLDGIRQALDPDEAINIQFTSGTTGAPKGATLTHANIVNNARFTVAAMGFTETDKLCIPVPLESPRVCLTWSNRLIPPS